MWQQLCQLGRGTLSTRIAEPSANHNMRLERCMSKSVNRGPSRTSSRTMGAIRAIKISITVKGELQHPQCTQSTGQPLVVGHPPLTCLLIISSAHNNFLYRPVSSLQIA